MDSLERSVLKNKNINRGAALIFALIVVAFLYIYVSIINVQVTKQYKGTNLTEASTQKYTSYTNVLAKRGTIYDANGLPLAQDIPSYTLVAVLDKEKFSVGKDKQPLHVVDAKQTAELIAPIIDMDIDEMLQILSKDKLQVEFGVKGKNLTIEQKEQIEALDLPGIEFIEGKRRFYPNGTLAAHTIGFSQLTDDTKAESQSEGKLGLEKSMDEFLAEKNGQAVYQLSSFGVVLKDQDQSKDPIDGKNVYLTLDQKIQIFLEDAMDAVVEDYEPEEIIGIVADPKTGKILAMAQRPTFDLNERNIENYLNTAVGYAYEPGSTMKIFTLAAAIEEGVWNPNLTFKSGKYKVGPSVISDHNGVGWGTITFLEGVQRSSNVLFINIGEKYLGYDTFRTYLDKFGFNQKVGIDLPNESAGKILFNYEVEKATSTFGQGTSVTPLQQIQAATAIANDGKMMKPYLIERIEDANTKEVIQQTKPEVVGTPVSAKTAKEVREILQTTVTSEVGTAQNYNIDEYEVAGKTGTAQLPAKGGGYLTGWNNYFFSFLGMVPADDPELLVYISVKQPKLDAKKYEAGSVPVSKIFNRVVINTLQYMNVQPNEEKVSVTKYETKLPDFIGLSLAEAKKMAKSKELSVTVVGNGKKIVSQYPEQDSTVPLTEKILLFTDGKLTMPDLTGWSMREIMNISSLLNLNVTFEGEGYAYAQTIPSGRTLEGEKIDLIVQMKPPNEKNKKTTSVVQDGTEVPLN